MGFSASDAAFEGFRITRERPLPVLLWSLVYLVVAAIGSALMVLTLGPDMGRLAEMTPEASSNPEEVLAMVPVMAKVYAIALPLGLIWLAIFSAAIYRTVLRPSDTRFGYLRLSGDELRLTLLYIVLLLITFVVLFASTIVGTLAAMPLVAVAGPVGGALVMTALTMLGVVAAMAWVGVRLSLTGPWTFNTGKIDLKGAWLLTRGRFWPMLGAYILAVVLATIVGVLGLVIILAAATVTGGGLSDISQPDYSSLAGYFTPTRIVQLVVSAVVSTLQYVILLAPAAAIYRALAAETVPEEAFT